MFQFFHNYGRPRTLVNGFWTPTRFRNPATGGCGNPVILLNGYRNPSTLVNGFRNPVIGRFRNPATLVNDFRMPAEFRNPATSKGNLVSTTLMGWNKQRPFRCNRTPAIRKMDPTIFTMELFLTKVSSCTIVTKSCILGKAGFKMNDYLTYIEAEVSNTQFFLPFRICRFYILDHPIIFL